MLHIQRGSEAFTHIERIMADPATHTLHLVTREDPERVAIKRNEGMWTAPLATLVNSSNIAHICWKCSPNPDNPQSFRVTGRTRTTERDRTLGPTELYELTCGHWSMGLD